MLRWVEASARWRDWWYGIDTYAASLDAAQRNNADLSPYEPLRYAAVHVILREITLGKDDVFFDVGCGKGRILCLVARNRLKKCIGIESVSSLAEAARANSRRVRGLQTPIEIRVEDASLADYSDATLICFYNPFGIERMRRCLARIAESLGRRPRRIRIIYVNPIAEQALRECERWLKPIKTFRVPYKWHHRSTVSVWESR